MNRRQINHGDAVEFRYIILSPAGRPETLVLVPSAYDEVVEQERVYFLRRHPDGKLCEPHVHESLDDARSCTDRTELGPLWRGIAQVLADANQRISLEYEKYRNDDGELSPEAWLELRRLEDRTTSPPKGIGRSGCP